MIGRSGGGIRQVALAQQLGMEGPSLVRLLDKLAAQGLLRRQADSSDRRANQLWLTDAGQALVGQIEIRLDALRAQVLGALSDADVQVVLTLWEQIAQAHARLSQAD